MLVLNQLPNVQILNGRSTKDDEEDEEEEERDSIENEDFENKEKNRKNNFFPQIEEIEEDKNMDNNSNYISNENNNNSNLNENENILINNNKINENNRKNTKNSFEKEKNIVNKINMNIDEKKDNNNYTEENQANTPLYDKIISNNSNNKINSNNAEENKKEHFNKIKKENEINNKNNNKNKNFLIDITNEELNILKEDKSDINSDFISFLKDFCDIINNEEKDEENKIINIYINKIKEIENKKSNIPNYYYFYLLLKKKMKIIKNIFDEIFPYILNKCPEINKNNILIKLNNELVNSIKLSKELMSTLHLHIESYNKTESNNLNENINKINNNNDNNINEIIKEKNNIISSLEFQRDKLFKTMNEEQITYEKKIATLEKENKIMTQKLFNQANNIINSPKFENNANLSPINKNISSDGYGQRQINFRNHSQTPDKSRKTKFENYNKHKRNYDNNIKYNKTRSPLKSSELTISLDNNNNTINYMNINDNINTSKHHLISLKNLKYFMNEIYLSKSNYDNKCQEFKLPKETLEEHMYTYLNKKYGLKKLIIDWARNIINGIKYYSKKDSFVLLFGKIMRNEQEEEARFIIQKVSESIEDLLLYYIKRQNPLKSLNEIKKLFEKKKKSELFEEEWKGIIYSIYENGEAVEIEKKIEAFINKENEKKKLEMIKNYKISRIINNKSNKYNNANLINNNFNNSFYLNTINSSNNVINNSLSSPNNPSYMNTINNMGNVKLSRVEKYNMILFKDDKNILFPDFLKIVLDNHIRFRDKQLKKFVDIFKSVDTNKDGVINEEEFGELIRKMKLFKGDEIENKILQFLEKIDPFDNQKFTFSECISFFSGELIKDIDINGNEKEMSVLEKICLSGEKNENGNLKTSNNHNESNEKEQLENSINMSNNYPNNNINKSENNNNNEEL